MSRNRIIAIDGPSASGKSTVARGVATYFPGMIYVDSGALYRGITWKVLQEGVDPQDAQQVGQVLARSRWSFEVREGNMAFAIDGEDPAEALRGEAVRENVSFVARIPGVRSFVVDRLRGMRAMGPLAVEGRDIGSVVFPSTPFKYYLDADPGERARRRNAEIEALEGSSSVEAVMDSLRRRDHLDSTRATAPLQVAEGAVIVDSTHLTLQEVIDTIVGDVERAGE